MVWIGGLDLILWLSVNGTPGSKASMKGEASPGSRVGPAGLEASVSTCNEGFADWETPT